MLTKTMERPAEIENQSSENAIGELDAPIWSVVSFNQRLAGNLTYSQAVEKLNEFLRAKTSGLCIITDEAASRIGEQSS